MKISIIGNKGQLGTDMTLLSKHDGHEVSGIDFPDIDITDYRSTQTALAKSGADVIINCAAYTAVDSCEENQETAFRVNAQGASNLAKVAQSIDASLVHISTDYVFNGNATQPYTEDDQPDPQTVYGKSKLQGEIEVASNCRKHYIFRIAWLYGTYGNNFVKTILKAGRSREATGEPLKVVNDQFGTPTWTVDVGLQILKCIKTSHYGLYHCTSEGMCSWYDFAREIIDSAHIATPVNACSTLEYPRPAARPKYSVLENARLKKLGLNIMTDWKQAYNRFFRENSKNLLV